MKKVCLLVLAGMMAAAAGRAMTLAENFSSNPLQDGWQMFGDTNLFEWDAKNGNLDVTWDSSQPNSYFYHALGTILTTNDDFTLSFDLQLVSLDPSSGGMQVAVGFFNLADAQDPTFERTDADGTPPNIPTNIVEFDYFPVGSDNQNPYYVPSVFPAYIDTNGYYPYEPSGLADFELLPGEWYHVVMSYTAADQVLLVTVTNFPQTSGTSTIDSLISPFTDFRLDTLSISSYSAAGDLYGDTILAEGAVANIVATLPPSPVQNLTGTLSNGVWQAQFSSQSNWLYALQRTGDFQSWTNVSPTTSGNGTNLILQDANPPADQAFYRVSASRP
jgi:hypothetical protein